MLDFSEKLLIIVSNFDLSLTILISLTNFLDKQIKFAFFNKYLKRIFLKFDFIT